MTVLSLFILPSGVESIEKLGKLVKATEWLSQDLNPKLQDLVQVYDCVLLNKQFYKGTPSFKPWLIFNYVLLTCLSQFY